MSEPRSGAPQARETAALLDAPRAVRPGEEIDGPRLLAFLRGCVPDLEGPLEIEQFPRGFSNLTYRIGAGAREWVLRRPPRGSQVKSAHDMSREYGILTRLAPVYSRVPRPLAYCDDATVIGAPFYLMERVRGVILRDRLPPGLDLGPAAMRALAEAAVDNLADIHAVDCAAVGLDALGRPGGYAARQIAGWTERWQRARTDDVPAVDRVAAWLAEHLPPPLPPALIHNDYKYDNLVLDPESLAEFPRPAVGESDLHPTINPAGLIPRPAVGESDLHSTINPAGLIRATLDWEMATVGDPGMDLGTTLGYWVEAGDPEPLKALRLGLTALPGSLTRAEVVERYRARTGRALTAASWYHAYGRFKIAVVAQQIYARWKQGLTRDERFASLLDAVRILGEAAETAARG